MTSARNLRIVTWNVNGLSSLESYFPSLLSNLPPKQRSMKAFLDAFEADIICFQETKLMRGKVDHKLAFVPGYDAYFSFSHFKKVIVPLL